MAGPPKRAPQAPKKHSPERPSTERVIGLSAARAVLQVRPRDVLNIAHTPEARREVAQLLREAARLRLPYREVGSEELGRIAGTLHHEGICLQVQPRLPVHITDLVRALAQGGFVVALDNVLNPHNVGALLRSAAYFGAAGMLVGSSTERGLTPASVRIAEGGAEHVPVCFVADLGDALDRLTSAGAEVVGADAHEGLPLGEARFAEKSVLVLGSERSGLSPAVQKRCTRLVRIAGADHIESLNVSVAAGIVMAHAANRSRERKRSP